MKKKISIAVVSITALIGVFLGNNNFAEAATVVPYPRVPGLGSSSVYSVKVNGQSVPVSAYHGGKSFVWFAFSGSVNVEITLNQNINSYVLSPQRLPTSATVNGKTLTFQLNSPKKLVLRNVNGISEELIILADPLETNIPTLGSPTVFSVGSYGADANGVNDSTDAIQKAIDKASSVGGGVAYVPPGTYNIKSTVFLKNNVNLYLAPGSVLRVPVGVGCCYSSATVIYAGDTTNTTISGRGVIYGAGRQQSLFFWLLTTENANNFNVKDIMILDSYTTGVRLYANSASIENAKILTYPNGLADGIDIESSQNITVKNNFILSTDDNIAIGAGTTPRATALSGENYSITGNLFYQLQSGHVLSIVPNKGVSYIRNINFDNNDSVSVDSIFGIYPFGGTNVSGVSFTNSRFEGVRGRPIDFWQGDCTSWGPGNCGSPAGVVGHIRDVKIESVTVDTFGAQRSQIYSALSDMDRISFKDFYMGGGLISSASQGRIDVTGNVNNLTFTKTAPVVTVAPPVVVTQSSQIYVSDLVPVSSTNGWGPYEKDLSNGESMAGDGKAITLNGTTYIKGLGVHAHSDLLYQVPSQCTSMSAVVGVDDEVGVGGIVNFEVYTDGTKVFDSGPMDGNSNSVNVLVDVSLKSQVRLLVSDGGNTNNSDHADWADAKFNCTSQIYVTQPTVVESPPVTTPTTVVATPVLPAAPVSVTGAGGSTQNTSSVVQTFQNVGGGGGGGFASGSSVSTGTGVNTKAPPNIPSAVKLVTKNLYKSSKNEEVTILQQFLVKKGYLASDNVTGFFGGATEQAVKKFQAAEKIVSSGGPTSTGYGFVGPSTRARINQYLQSENVSNSTVINGATMSISDINSQILILQQRVAELLLQLQSLSRPGAAANSGL